MYDERVTFVVLARAGSKRLVGKNCLQLGGIELIKWPLIIAKQVFDTLWVSTDGQRIEELAREVGARVHRRSPVSADDLASSVSSLVEFLQAVQPRTEFVMLAQCTSPLLSRQDIETALDLTLRQGYDSVFSVCADKPKLCWKQTDSGLEPVNFSPTQRPRSQDVGSQLMETGHLYMTRCDLLIQHASLQAGRCWYVTIPAYRVCDIDTQHDLDFAEFLAKKHNLVSDLFPQDFSRISHENELEENADHTKM